MKSSQIKIWPEIQGYLPMIVPWQGVENNESDLFIDFSNCKSVYSSSLTPLLIRIIKLIIQKKNRKWETHNEIISEPFLKIINLNFFNILDYYELNTSMFWNKDFSIYNFQKIKERNITTIEVHSIPIYHINIENYTVRREVLKTFRKEINILLAPYFENYDFNITQLILILNEILKNTADHTSTNAFFGMDVLFTSSQMIEINFAIGDLGVGINMNVKNHLPEEQLKRYEFWDLTQTYRFALSRGNTTKQDSINNKGMGMSIILDGAKEIGLELSVFDAESRGLLSEIESLTHSELRKNFYNVGRNIGFYYHGKLKAKRI